MKTLSILLGAVLLLVFAGWLVFSRGSKPKADTGLPAQNIGSTGDESLPRRPLPDLVLEDYNGLPRRLGEFKGKALVVNAWAAWCPFCGKELADFALAQQEFGERALIVAIDRAESREMAKRFTDNLGVSDALVFLLDPEDSFYRAIGGFSMPETIFVDRDGFIREHKRGPMELNEIRQRVQTLLSQDQSF